MKSCRIFSILLAAVAGFAALRAADLPVGKVIESVDCEKEPKQSYALYVPSTYDASRRWPVIFCFDPGARGRAPVERFQAAAEKFGWLVAGSNNSRNGSWEGSMAAIHAMVGDVEARFRLDAGRVYTAGLSGGARVALQAALMGLGKGVIACSAGFPGDQDAIPANMPFAIFGTAGIEDFNNLEMKRLDWALDERGATHRVIVWNGGHAWAPAEILADAIAWLELQAMRAGARAKDEALIQETLRARIAALPKEPAGEVWRETTSLAADFAGLADVTEFAQRARELAGTREVKAWRKAEKAAVDREVSELIALDEAGMGGSVTSARKLAAALKKRADATGDTADRQMARRERAAFGQQVRDRTGELFRIGAYADAAVFLEMADELRPMQSRTLYDLARARGLQGDKKRALETLTQASAAGFSVAARTEAEPGFAKLREQAAYKEALAKMRANPPEPDRPWRERP